MRFRGVKVRKLGFALKTDPLKAVKSSKKQIFHPSNKPKKTQKYKNRN